MVSHQKRASSMWKVSAVLSEERKKFLSLEGTLWERETGRKEELS